MKRPCYLAGGTTEREDPPSGSHVVTHTHTQRARARQRRTECRRKGMRARESRRTEEKGWRGSNEDGCIEGWSRREKDGER